MMKVIRGDYYWLESLMNGSSNVDLFRVHTVFEHAINLVDANQILYTLVSREKGLAPNTLQLDCSLFSQTDIKLNTYFKISDIVSGFNQAERWKPFLPEYIDLDCALLINQIQGYLTDPLPSENIFNTRVYHYIDQLSNNLIKSFENDDIELIKQLLKKFIGLGIGLTPTGDDLLVGLCAFISAKNHPLSPIYSLCKRVINDAKESTNEISYAALNHASQDRFNEPLLNFICSLYQIEQKNYTENLIKNLKAVLDIGSTSGSDMLRGVVLGLSLLTKNESILYQSK